MNDLMQVFVRDVAPLLPALQEHLMDVEPRRFTDREIAKYDDAARSELLRIVAQGDFSRLDALGKTMREMIASIVDSLFDAPKYDGDWFIGHLPPDAGEADRRLAALEFLLRRHSEVRN